METPVNDIVSQTKNDQDNFALLYDPSASISEYHKKNKDMSSVRDIEDIDSLYEEVEEILNCLKTEEISSKLDLAISGEKVISGDILKLSDSISKTGLRVKKLQSSISRLAEKTSKRLRTIRIIQIITLLFLFLYIVCELYQKFLL